MKYPESSNGEGAARRFEHRIAGADANPYLSLAAIKHAEQEEFSGAVTPLEYDSYLVLA